MKIIIENNIIELYYTDKKIEYCVGLFAVRDGSIFFNNVDKEISVLYTEIETINGVVPTSIVDAVSKIRNAMSTPPVKELIVETRNIGAVDDTWINQGGKIDCKGHTSLGIFIELIVNDSTGNQIQVLCEYASGLSKAFVLETTRKYQQTLGDADINIMYPFGLSDIVSVQIQTKATVIDTGGGITATVTINVTKN